MSLTKLSIGGNNLYMTSVFSPKESLVSDIPAGDGNIEKLFLQWGFWNIETLTLEIIKIHGTEIFVRNEDQLSLYPNP